MSVLEQLGTHVAHDYRETLSDGVRESARLHLVDTVGAWIAASGTTEGRALMRFLAGREQTGADPVGENTLSRVACNCGLARLSEIDDIHLSSCTTPGALIVPSALTIGSSLGASGDAIGDAIGVGYEAMVRLGLALDGPSLLYRGIWPTYFTAPFGVAAVASRLLDLTGAQAAHALGIALTLASPAVGRQGGAAMSRWLAIGHAARSGVFAALSAQAGFPADLGIFEGDFFSAPYGLLPPTASPVPCLAGSSRVSPRV